MDKKVPKQEFREDGAHRLVSHDGKRATEWANYRRFTYMDGYVGYTAYYLPEEGVSTCEEFCAHVGVGESNPDLSPQS